MTDFEQGLQDGFIDQQQADIKKLEDTQVSETYAAGYIVGRAQAAAPHEKDVLAINTYAAEFCKTSPQWIPAVRSGLKKVGVLIPMRFDFLINP